MTWTTESAGTPAELKSTLSQLVLAGFHNPVPFSV